MKREVLNSTATRTVWLSCNANPLELHYTLCTTEEAFRTAWQSVAPNDRPVPQWVTRQYGAQCHPVHCRDRNELHVVVAFSAHPKSPPIENAGLLVHEAVHIFQYHTEAIGETAPGQENEAYSIQHIAQCLMLSYAQTL